MDATKKYCLWIRVKSAENAVTFSTLINNDFLKESLLCSFTTQLTSINKQTKTMKNILRLFIQIMKITLFQFVLAFVFSTVTFASTIRVKKIGYKDYNLCNWYEPDVVLNKLENYLTWKFSYNSRMSQLNQK
jgi:hypothetical protein